MNLNHFFNAKTIAIIGASRDQNKVGHVIFRNFIDNKYDGKVYPINPHADHILGHKCYKSILNIKDTIDLVVIAVPYKFVLDVIKECGKKHVKNVIMVTAGFREVGNVKLTEKLEKLLQKYKIKVIGPNCLGTFNAYSKLDTLFLPHYKLQRPKEGDISFISQSGAVGSAILDLASKEGYGFAKFISYGNAISVDESDIIKYLNDDKETGVICAYIETIKNGKKFIEVCKKATKPIIIMKGGITNEGGKATLSHTGSLAGLGAIYEGVFKQCNVIHACSLEEMFNFACILEKSIKPKGKRVQIITNGGGYGVLSTDAVVENGLSMAKLGKVTISKLKKQFPPIVIVNNPMDLIGDATTKRYKTAIEACFDDDNVDILLVVLLYQTPLLTTDIVDVISEFNSMHKKPIIVASTGGEFTELLKKSLESNRVPCYTFPENAVKAIKRLVEFYNLD